MTDYMARRLVNTPLVNQKDSFTFELFDMDSASVDLDYVVEFDANGFELNWKGDDKDSPIIGSTCSWTMFLTEAQRSAVMPVVFAEREFRMCVRIKRNGNVFWVGVVHPERASEVITDGVAAVSLIASDGLGMLSNIDWVDGDGNRYTGLMKFRDAVWSALNKLPHISLIGGVGTPVLREHSLIHPVTQEGSELFSHVALNSNYYGTMDYLKLDPNTFYYSTIEEEKIVYGQDFMSIDRFNPDDFTDSRLVLKDLMSSIGASICFAEGVFNVFDKTQNFMTAEGYTYTVLDWGVTSSGSLDDPAVLVSTSYSGTMYDKGALGYQGSSAHNANHRVDFAKGIARRASYPVRAVTQKHVRAGTDLLYANGVGYYDNEQRAVWERGEGYERKLLDFYRQDRFSDADSTELAYKGKFHAGASITWDGLFNTRQRSRVITDIQIPNGSNDGAVRIALGGTANYTHRNVFGQPETWGSLAIFKMRVELFDGTETYRLSRPVRTLSYSSTGTTADVDITGSGATRYHVKVWQGTYEWVPSSDAGYSEAWLDIPLGANNSVIEEGESSKFMQTDYPLLDCYTPPLTKLDGSADNVLTKDQDRKDYRWRHDFVYDTPTASGNIQQITIKEPVLEEWESESGPNMIYAVTGAAIDLGFNYGSPTYRTETNSTSTDGTGAKPNSLVGFELDGLEVFFGDGTKEFDQTSVAYPDTPQGRQVLNLNNTRLGGSFVDLGGSPNGRFLCGDFIDPDRQARDLKFKRGWDSTLKESAGELVTGNFLEMRSRVNEVVVGSCKLGWDSVSTSDAPILLPYNRLVTDTLDTTSRMLIPYEVSFSPTGGVQRFEAWFRNVSAIANIGATTQGELDGTKGPGPATGNINNPSGSDLYDFVQAEATTDTGGGTAKPQFGDIFPIFIKG